MEPAVPSGTPMTDVASTRDLLTLAQWLSPAFPLGSFAYSHGLEQAVADGVVADAPSFVAWLAAVLDRGAGRADAILLALAHREALRPAELAAWAEALAAGRERWEETLSQGAAFTRTTNALLQTDLGPLPLPVAVGVQARRLSLPTVSVAALFLQAFAGNLATVAARLIPLGQTASQAALAAQADRIVEIAEAAAVARLDDIAMSVPAGDLASLRHETAPVRLFRT